MSDVDVLILHSPDSPRTSAAVRLALTAYRVPCWLHDGLIRYLLDGVLPGQFLQAVLANDLVDAVTRADDTNVHHLRDVVRFLLNETPSPCHGSRDKVAAWCDRQHLHARREQIAVVSKRLREAVRR